MSYLLTIAVIALLIVIHELGHLLVAKAFGIGIKRFSVGFGKVLWSRQWGSTEYALSLIPLGGYVMPSAEDENEFNQIANYKRTLFALGGPLANIVAAYVGIAILNMWVHDLSILPAFSQAITQTSDLCGKILIALSQLAGNSEGLTGIVGIIALGSDSITANGLTLLNFSIMVNLNLALFNLLPLPPLDGGKIVFNIRNYLGQM